MMDIKGGPKSADISTFGHKTYKFKDGQTVDCTLTTFRLWNIMFGTLSWQVVGEWKLEDRENNIIASVVIGQEEGKTQDYFSGEIFKDEISVCEISGNYMGYVDFDGERYWDLRDEKD